MSILYVCEVLAPCSCDVIPDLLIRVACIFLELTCKAAFAAWIADSTTCGAKGSNQASKEDKSAEETVGLTAGGGSGGPDTAGSAARVTAGSAARGTAAWAAGTAAWAAEILL